MGSKRTLCFLVALLGLVLLLNAEQIQKSLRQREVHLRALSKPLQTLQEPQFNNDARYQTYLQGSENNWRRIKLSPKTKTDESSSIVEKHPYIIHFGQRAFVDPETKSVIEKRINSLQGCHASEGDFTFDKDSHYLAFNSYLVYCEESTIAQLQEAIGEAIWIGAWLPHYKYSKLSSNNQVVVHTFGLTTEEEALDIFQALIVEVKNRFKLPSGISLEYLDARRFVMSLSDKVLLNKRLLQHMYSYLSHQSFVHFIEDKPQMKVLNQNAAWVVQSGKTDGYYAYDEKLDGTGQIIGCADTGLDYDNCFFNDPSVAIPIGTVNNNHRKVVSYRKRPSAVYGDEVSGHGTHVLGSIAGNPIGSGASTSDIEGVHVGTGVGKGAKISFLGLSPGGGELDVPASLTGAFFQDSYDDGARVHSNSWGCSSADPTDCNVYSGQASDVDSFMFTHPDYLILFAAGNDGDSGANTVGSPATAKNCLSVGASVSDTASYSNITKYIDYEEIIAQCCAVGCLDGGCPSSPDDCCAKNIIGCCPSKQQEAYAVADNYNSNNLAFFSSLGPANLGGTRLKPDVVAPGDYIVSAYSDGSLTSNQCGVQSPAQGNAAALVAKRGTSMATPVTAGTLAILRQYLTTGYYPSGSSSTSQAMNPSAALMKALIICSATSLTGTHVDGNGNSEQVQEAPSFQQGFGRVELDRVLYFSDSVSQSLFIDDSSSLSTSNEKSYSVSVAKEHTVLSIVLAWTDPAGTVSSSNPLVNNLDLVATAPDGTQYTGNNAGVYKAGNYVDDQNNVERIYVQTPAAGKWTFVVKGTNVAVNGTQSYAVVASASPESIERKPKSVWITILIVIVVVAAVALVVAVTVFIIKKRQRAAKFNSDLQDPLLVN